MAEEESKKVSFPVNEHGWIMLSQVLGKVVMRAHKVGKPKRKSETHNQHRAFEFECEGAVEVRSKLYDTSHFI